ncbi:TonB-dependent receptor [Terriglobus aquaticus]|uniref:Carboxypeptidase regulatory-like domain-containing protein n=1 Tax=Terriglobus aquaticus TaxID=940139 RepID=A0ABW9KJX7_9BACT|nr:carboxypeptidase regulatory-like domain-containing protein [Terriglobus aquaticus]
MSHRHPFGSRPLASVLGLALLPAVTFQAHAQTFRGSISGNLQDPSGAAVAGATITATQEDTGIARTTVSSSSGDYTFADLPLGQYTVTVSVSSFQPYAVKGVTVSAGSTYSLPIRLAVSEQTATVDVSASALALDTANMQQTTTLPEHLLQDVPLNGRDFKKLVGVLPGFGGYSGVLGSINGARANQTNWQIDGTDNNDLWTNNSAVNQSGVQGIAGTLMPVDAIQEFSLVTQSTAESGRDPGATANLIIKSGTNQFHGSAYYFNRHEALSVDPVFVPKKKLRNENFGGSIGGPIVPNRTFWFLAFERQQFTIGIQGLGTEPSAAYQNEARNLLALNGIPVNPLSQTLLNTLWEPGALTGPANSGNFSPGLETGFSNNGVLKLDHTFGANDYLSFRYFIGQGNQVAPSGNVVQNSYFEIAPIHIQNYSVVYNHTFSPRVTNQVLLGVSAYNQKFDDFNHSFDVNTLGLNIGNTGLTGAPNIILSGFDQIGVNPPQGRRDITGHVTDALTYVVGSHSFRFGGEYRKAQLDEFYHRNGLGTFNFDGTRGRRQLNGSAVAYPNNPYTDSNVASLADFLAGYVSTSNLARGNPERLVYMNTFDLFAQDAWQVNRRLNVNYGVRWDYEGPIHNGDKNLPTFVPSLGGLVVQGQTIDNLYPQRWLNFGPRVGFAFQPRPDAGTVFRGSYGLFYDTTAISPFLDNRPSGTTAPNGLEGNPAGTSPVQTITQNAYAIAAGQPLFAGGPASIVGLFSVSQSFKTPVSQNFTFSVEQQVGNAAIFSLGYVGSQSRHQVALRDINQVNPNAASTTPVQLLRPYYRQFPNFGAINQVESIANGNYNGLQATLRSNRWHGLTAQVNYTWSHSLDTMTQYRARLPQDSRNFKAEYGNSDYDTRHAANGAISYDIPRLTGGPRRLTEGWQVNAAFNLHGGQPFNIVTASDNSGTADRYQRPNVTGASAATAHTFVPNGASRYVQWISPGAFAQPAAGTFGNLRRNAFYGPGYADTDVSLFKTTKLAERVSLQLRVEMFNVGNRINLAPPSASFGSASFGRVTDTIGDYNGAPGIGPGEPYNTQIAAKLLF